MAIKRIGVRFAGQGAPAHTDHTFPIPSAFVKLDSNVSAADSFVNVRDEMVKRQNHNILIAKRCKRNVLHLIGGTSYDVGQRLPIDPYHSPPERIVPLFLSQHTKQVRVVVRCMQSRAAAAGDNDPQLGFVLCSHKSTRRTAATEVETVTTAYAATPDNSDWGVHSFDLDVPAHDGESPLLGGQLVFDLYMMAYAPVNDSAESSGHSVTDVGENWFETSSNTGDRKSKIIIVDYGGGDQERRMVQRTTRNYRHYVDEPWSHRPNPGTSTVDTYSAMFISIGSISIFELDVTSLREQPGRS